MKRLLAAAALLLAPCLATAAAKKQLPKVAVLDIRALQGAHEDTVQIILEMITTALAEKKRYDVIGKADVTALIGLDRQRKMLGCKDDNACLANIGGAMGVEYLVTGQLGKLGSRYRLSLNLLDVRKNKSLSRPSDFCDGNDDALAAKTQQLVAKLLAELDAAVGADKSLQPEPVAPVAEVKPADPPKPKEPPKPAEPANPPPVAQRPEPPPPPDLEARAPAQPSSPLRTAGLAIGGVGLAGLVAGGVFDAIYAKNLSDMKSEQTAPNDSRYNEAKAFAGTARVAGMIGYGVGVVGLAAGLTMYLLAPSAPSTDSAIFVAPAPGGAVAGLRGSLP
jgi:TolB-like protein